MCLHCADWPQIELEGSSESCGDTSENGYGSSVSCTALASAATAVREAESGEDFRGPSMAYRRQVRLDKALQALMPGKIKSALGHEGAAPRIQAV